MLSGMFLWLCAFMPSFLMYVRVCCGCALLCDVVIPVVCCYVLLCLCVVLFCACVYCLCAFSVRCCMRCVRGWFRMVVCAALFNYMCVAFLMYCMMLYGAFWFAYVCV